MIITEHINIFNLVRIPNLYDFVRYFKKMRIKFDTQSSDTKMDINDYLEQTENISQEIIIVMIFNIETNMDNLIKKKEEVISFLKVNNLNEDIFDIIDDDFK